VDCLDRTVEWLWQTESITKKRSLKSNKTYFKLFMQLRKLWRINKKLLSLSQQVNFCGNVPQNIKKDLYIINIIIFLRHNCCSW
jgi:hypothetical protein